MKILILLLLFSGFWWSIRSIEPRTLYYPDRTLIGNPSVYRLTYENLKLLTEDGLFIHGWYLPGEKPITILLCHGNAGNISHRLEKAVRLHPTGSGLLLFDYRGYGQSEGKPTETGTYRDAEAAYRYLIDTKHLKPEQVVFYGESLGGAVAVEMAIRHPNAGGLILDSAFTSTIDMAKRLFPWLPVTWIVRYRYDNLSKIPQIKMPLLMLHSPKDEIIPFEMGQRLFAAAPEPKRFVELVGSHNEGFIDSGDRYTNAVNAFLGELPARRVDDFQSSDPARLQAVVVRLSHDVLPRDYAHPENLDRAAGYLATQFKQWTPSVTTDVFDVKDHSGPLAGYQNIVASFGPSTGDRLVVGAHYDAVAGSPGADDNASGVAGLLELARLLHAHPPALRTDLVAFTLEEPPYHRDPSTGSGWYAEKLKREGVWVRAMFSLEMIGTFSDVQGSQHYDWLPFLRLFYPSTGDFIAVVGRWPDQGLSRQVAAAMRRGGSLPVCRLQAPRFTPGVSYSDHNNFWNQGYPALMITDTAFLRNRHYHTAEDTSEKLNYRRMALVVDGVFRAVQDQGESSRRAVSQSSRTK